MTSTFADDESPTFWPRVFVAARRHADWHQVPRVFAIAAARQLADAITTAPEQDPRWRTAMGIHDGEAWAARTEATDDGVVLFVRLERAMRNTFWARTFGEARRTGTWTEVPRRYTRATAQQIASDIGNAHRRKPAHQRVRGIIEGEVWEARWEPIDSNVNGDHRVIVRLRPADT